jgi:hypothetical protein
MQHDDLPVDDGAIEDAGYSIRGFQSKFKQAVSHCAGVGHAKVGPVKLHSLRVLQESCNEAGGKRQDFSL